MKAIGLAVFSILSAHWAFASDFEFPVLKYDQREPGSLPSTPAQGRKSVELSRPEASEVSKPHVASGTIGRDGIIVPASPFIRSSQELGVIDPDYKLRVLEAPKVDQKMVIKPDAK